MSAPPTFALQAHPDAIELPLEQITDGGALVDEAERIARREGAASLWVIANTRALDLYGACGFVTVGEVATRFRPAPRMRKAIDVAR